MLRKCQTKKPSQVIEHEEYLENGDVFHDTRNGIFYARVYKGEGTRKYIHRTLKTRNLPEALKRAMKFFTKPSVIKMKTCRCSKRRLTT
jgi:hypothetical protein